MFDYGAADEAASSLERAAQSLRISYDGVASESRVRTQDWAGRHRDGFDDALVRSSSFAASDIDSVLWEAGRIRRAMADARAEQSRREAQRQQWMAEAAAEEAARVAAAIQAAADAARAAAQAAADAAAATAAATAAADAGAL